MRGVEVTVLRRALCPVPIVGGRGQMAQWQSCHAPPYAGLARTWNFTPATLPSPIAPRPALGQPRIPRPRDAHGAFGHLRDDWILIQLDIASPKVQRDPHENRTRR